jgi:hypothetical protein
MRLIEPDEHKEFLATLERTGHARDDFSLQELAITHTRPARVHIPAECQSDGAYRAT